jgi:hypothetical protein
MAQFVDGPQPGLGRDLGKVMTEVARVDGLPYGVVRSSPRSPLRSGRQPFGGFGGPVVPERGHQTVGGG